MKYELLAIYKWRPSLGGLFLMLLGTYDIMKSEDYHMNIFFIILANYIIIMYSKIYQSEHGRLLSLEDLRLRKVIKNQPKNRLTRIIQELILMSFSTLLFYMFTEVDPEGILTYLLILYILYGILKTANFNTNINP
ncbi:hypothetical protein PQO03_02720 [Lentisphaera profundi]|uniref:Uncharacterized protein n=1 Tax=Lentisphaera profundi TaxID=1658616 RepID=A0ABY7VRP3_9BACT|nr:hypothetical protein [Lentisphaera profundi]WDE96873.1 hypothetical protein PQO03_02720 [Lentisphaera profundi]